MSMTKIRSKSAFSSDAEPFDDRPNIGGFEVTKVVREYVPVKGGGTGTYGAALDSILNEAASKGEEIQDVKFMIETDDWRNYVNKYHSGQ